MKRIFFLAITVLFISLTSCDGVESLQLDANALAGTWTLLTIDAKPIDNSFAEELLINADGTWDLHTNTANSVPTFVWSKYSNLSYSIDKNVITVKGEAAKKMDFKAQVLMFTPNTLTVRITSIAESNELAIDLGMTFSFYRADIVDYSTMILGNWPMNVVANAASIEEWRFYKDGEDDMLSIGVSKTANYYLYGDVLVIDSPTELLITKITIIENILTVTNKVGDNPLVSWVGEKEEE